MKITLPAPVNGVNQLVDVYAQLGVGADSAVQVENISDFNIHVFCGDALVPPAEYFVIEPRDTMDFSGTVLSAYGNIEARIVANVDSGLLSL